MALKDVRIGYLEGPSASMELEESSSNYSAGNQQANVRSMSSSIPIMGSQTSAGQGSGVSGSPPQQTGGFSMSSGVGIGGGGRTSPQLQTPPNSASSHRESRFTDSPLAQSQSGGFESVELQVDYWPVMRPSDFASKDKGSATKSSDQGGKNSIKSSFRNLQVWRLPQNAQMGDMTNGLTLSFATKEKKQKQCKLLLAFSVLYDFDLMEFFFFFYIINVISNAFG